MKFLARLKALLGLARAVSPDVDKAVKKAEAEAQKLEQAAATARQVADLIKEIKG